MEINEKGFTKSVYKLIKTRNNEAITKVKSQCEKIENFSVKVKVHQRFGSESLFLMNDCEAFYYHME